MRKRFAGVVVASVVCVVAGTGFAQMRGGPGSDPISMAMQGINKVMAQKSLSATVVTSMKDAGGMARGPGAMEFKMFMKKGMTCTEMDLGKIAADAAANAGSAGAPPMGMGKLISIVRPDKKVIFQVMPDANAYCEMPLIQGPGGETGEGAKIDRKVLGNEKVEKYNCEKVQNTVKTPEGRESVIMTWEAKELKGLPVKSEFTTPEGGTITTLFKNISTADPEDSLFEPPTGATRYGSMMEMMMNTMMPPMNDGDSENSGGKELGR